MRYVENIIISRTDGFPKYAKYAKNGIRTGIARDGVTAESAKIAKGGN